MSEGKAPGKRPLFVPGGSPPGKGAKTGPPTGSPDSAHRLITVHVRASAHTRIVRYHFAYSGTGNPHRAALIELQRTVLSDGIGQVMEKTTWQGHGQTRLHNPNFLSTIEGHSNFMNDGAQCSPPPSS